MRRFYILPLSLLLCISATDCSYAQSSPVHYWEPEVAYTWKSGNWSQNLKWSGRTRISAPNRTEIQYFANRKLFAGRQLGGGYMLRWAEPFLEDEFGYEHRFIQQFAFLTHLGDQRLGNRFRLEQRIRRDRFINRVRYRLSYDFPLNGAQLDPGEMYLMLSNEVLFSFNSTQRLLDDRPYIGIGWYFNKTYKFETGIQYRSEDLLGEQGHVFHWITSFFINR